MSNKNPLANRSNWVIVDNLPAIRSSGQSSDYGKIATAFSSCAKACVKGSTAEPVVWIPHETNRIDKHTTEMQIYGYGLIAFANAEQRRRFCQMWQSHPQLKDYANRVQVFPYEKYLELQSMPEKYPKLSKDEFLNRNNLLWWLIDEDGGESYRDQYVIRFRKGNIEETEIYWNDEIVSNNGGRLLAYGGEKEKSQGKTMTHTYVRWSSQGLYLVTMHPQGIQLWGGPEWISVTKVPHNQASHIDFSPCDRFVVTCNAGGSYKENPPIVLKISDALTGKELRPFQNDKIGPTIKVRHKGWWPIIHWSYNGDYFAKLNSSKNMTAKARDYDKIDIYSSQDLKKLDKKSHHVPAIFHMQFSPTDNYLAYTTRQKDNDPSTVSIITLPTKNHARGSQVLGFDVGQAHIYWQSDGKFLAVKIGHLVSKKNNIIGSNSMGIMAIKKPGMPFLKTDEDLGKIEYFQWEPHSSRFAIIHKVKPKVIKKQATNSYYNNQSSMKGSSVTQGSAVTFVSFYNVTENGNPYLLFSLKNKRVNSIYWAPKGGHCVIGFIEKARNATLEFIDVNKSIKSKQQNIKIDTKEVEIDSCTEVHWDPSGRYLVTALTQALNSTAGDDTGYAIWSFQGNKLFEHKIRYFYQIFWRPRPRSLLTNKDEKNAKKNIKKYYNQFSSIDSERARKYFADYIRDHLIKGEKYDKLKKQWKNRSKNILEKRNQLKKHLFNIEYDKIYKDMESTVNTETIVISKNTLNRILNNENVDFERLDENGDEIMMGNNPWGQMQRNYN